MRKLGEVPVFGRWNLFADGYKTKELCHADDPELSGVGKVAKVVKGKVWFCEVRHARNVVLGAESTEAPRVELVEDIGIEGMVFVPRDLHPCAAIGDLTGKMVHGLNSICQGAAGDGGKVVEFLVPGLRTPDVSSEGKIAMSDVGFEVGIVTGRFVVMRQVVMIELSEEVHTLSGLGNGQL